LLVLAACKHPAAPHASADRCRAVSQKAVAVAQLASGREGARTVVQLEDAFAQRCSDDHWSAAMLDCADGATTHEQLHACAEQHLTKAQHEALGKAMAQLAAAPEDLYTSLVVTAIEPALGDADGGTYVRITGSHFISDGPRSAKVYFGERQGTVVRFASDTELIVEAPPGVDGTTVDVLVLFDPGGQKKLLGAFTFVHKP